MTALYTALKKHLVYFLSQKGSNRFAGEESGDIKRWRTLHTRSPACSVAEADVSLRSSLLKWKIPTEYANRGIQLMDCDLPF